VKRWRIYFNRIEDAPQIWSVDEGSHASEINVQGIQIISRDTETGQNLEAKDPEPKAWMWVVGRLEVKDGCAVIL